MTVHDAQFRGKRVLVTGGTRDMGEAITRRFAAAVATVFVAARDADNDRHQLKRKRRVPNPTMALAGALAATAHDIEPSGLQGFTLPASAIARFGGIVSGANMPGRCWSAGRRRRTAQISALW
jgi:NAD(P)-dependent dehydrogenase (short-subunit alcohol dehydrogenase family)